MAKMLKNLPSRIIFSLLICSQPALAADGVQNQAVKNWIAKKYETAGCHFPDSPTDEIYIHDVQYFDFNHDKKKEIIVNASTCWTGTAGADVHSALEAKGNNEFVELEIPEPDRKIYAAAKMQGNRNYSLNIEDGLLVANWHDQSERENSPLIVKYEWNGKDFSIISTKIHE